MVRQISELMVRMCDCSRGLADSEYQDSDQEEDLLIQTDALHSGFDSAFGLSLGAEMMEVQASPHGGAYFMDSSALHAPYHHSVNGQVEAGLQGIGICFRAKTPNPKP